MTPAEAAEEDRETQSGMRLIAWTFAGTTAVLVIGVIALVRHLITT